MKKQIALLIALVAAATSVLTAGPVELEPKATAPPTITNDDQWHFNIGMPGWFAFLSGDIGLHGATSNVNVDFDQLITHVTGIASISADVRKALASPEVQKKIADNGAVVDARDTKEWTAFVTREVATMRETVKNAGIKID